MVIPAWVLAADVDVTKTADTNDGVCDADCSLREAIGTANANDTVRIPAGVFTVGSELNIDKALALQGAGALVTIVQAAATPGTADHRIFNITTTSDVALLDMTIRHGRIVGTGNGGAILAPGGSGNLDIIRCNVVHNEVDADGSPKGGAASGGAIYFPGSGTVTIRDSNIADNHISADGRDFGGAGSGGAGFTGPLTIINSSVVRNTISTRGGIANGAASGGAFFNLALILTNSTVSDNGAIASAASGGAFFGGPAVISSSTLADNFLDANAASGGAIFADATIRNTIIADNSPGNCFGTVTSAGYNLIDDTTCGTPATGDQFDSQIDPRLAPPALNGATTETRALLIDSPAIDAGNPAGCVDENAMVLDTDQRGFARFDGNNDGVVVCDIGAFEFRGIQSAAPALGWLGLLTMAAALAGFGIRRLS